MGYEACLDMRFGRSNIPPAGFRIVFKGGLQKAATTGGGKQICDLTARSGRKEKTWQSKNFILSDDEF